jgi:hypothetical protein
MVKKIQKTIYQFVEKSMQPIIILVITFPKIVLFNFSFLDISFLCIRKLVLAEAKNIFLVNFPNFSFTK